MRARELMEGAAPRERFWVDELESGLAFASLRGEWGELLEESAAPPFLSWEWLYPWWRRVAPEARPRILAARDDAGKLSGLLPLCETRLWAGGIPVRRWGFLGDECVGSDYLDVLARPGLEERLTDLFVDQLEARLSRVDVLELLDLPKGSMLARKVLDRFAGRSLSAERFPRYVCPQVEVRGEYADFLKAAGRADNLARRKKWLVAQPGFAVERVEQARAVPPALDDFFRLHALRWAQDGGSQGIRTAAVHAFHRDATHFLAENGWLRLYTLKVASQALASVYGIVHRDRFYYYQSGYDPEWARRSVGLVLLGETFADAWKERRAAFDFLRGSEPYKREWATSLRETEGVRIVGRSAGGLAFLAAREGKGALKGAARKLVGEDAWARLSRLRRSRKA